MRKYVYVFYLNGKVIESYNVCEQEDVLNTIASINGKLYKVIKEYEPITTDNKIVIPCIVAEVVGVKYRWTAYCNDGAFTDESDGLFNTHKECYNDMRNKALMKMKWNTEFDEDFHNDNSIEYNVTFSKREITHTSYSGLYVYKVEELYEIKKDEYC